MKRFALVCALSFAAVGSTFAQVPGGNISGSVKDRQGGVRPKAVVTAKGVDATRTTTADARGEYRFLDLPPGPYEITATAEGFEGRARAIVAVGRNVDAPVEMNIVGAEIVEVSAPIIDLKSTSTATNISLAELENIPTSRDPFALFRTVPGVLLDQVNIGGNETGQQPVVFGKAARQQDTVWSVDGVEITDMGAPGFSPTYFGHDTFEEVQLFTAGHDIRSRTGGIGINLITKRGTNQLRGGFRSYYSGDALEGSNVPEELQLLDVKPDGADHTSQISDYGFDIGGPLVKDRVWFYGALSQQDIHVFKRTTQAIDKTKLRNPQLKLNWQASSQNMVNFLFINGYKVKSGRSNPANQTTLEDFEATHHQDNAYSDSPIHGLWKLGLDRVVSANTFLSTKYAYYNTGIKLTPEAGTDAQAGKNLDVPTRAYGSTVESLQVRPQHSVTADVTQFVQLFGFSHDVKYGFGYRNVLNQVQVEWPGNGILAIEQTGGSGNRAQVFRQVDGANRLKYLDLYVGDTLQFKKATIDVGLRYDRQWGEALPSTADGSKAFPDLIPGVIFPGYDSPFIWNNLSPRVGLSYLLDDVGKSVARVSYSRFAGQLAASTVGIRNPTTGNTPGNATYPWTDVNGDHFAQPEELDLTTVLANGGGFDPNNPTSVAPSPNQVDPNLKAPITQSVVLGIERELMPHTAVMIDYSYNRTSNLFGNMTANITPRNGTTLDSFVPGVILTGTLPDGSPYSVQTYKLDPEQFSALPSGNLTKNVPGYYTDYHGLELNLVRRLSNRWMGRVMVAFNNAREHFSDPAGVYNTNGNPTPTPAEPLVDGGQFAPTAQVAAGAFLNAKWQFNANGMYVGPYDIEIAGNVFGRQGYPFVIYRGAVQLGLESNQNVLVTPRIDTFRLDNVWNTDVRVARTFRFRTGGSNMNIRLMADVFNLFNANTELARVGNQGASGTSTSFNTLTKNLSPRILRLGLIVGF